MEGKYLNEENYQKINKNINKGGLALFIIGILMEITSIIVVVISIIGITNNANSSIFPLIICALLIAFGGVAVKLGMNLLFVGHKREIVAFQAQQVMPVAKEEIGEIAPTIGKSAGDIAAGIREGLNNNNDNNSNNQNNNVQ